MGGCGTGWIFSSFAVAALVVSQLALLSLPGGSGSKRRMYKSLVWGNNLSTNGSRQS